LFDALSTLFHEKGYKTRYGTDDVTIKLALSCDTHYCSNYPRPQRVLLVCSQALRFWWIFK